MDDGKTKPAAGAGAGNDARLKAALRANLARRKAQARARAAARHDGLGAGPTAQNDTAENAGNED